MIDEVDDAPFDPRTLPPSKSQRKRDASELQDLGACLVHLTAVQLRRIPLPDDVRAAVQAAQAITQHGGRKRQLKYIGKLLRAVDDIAQIRAALAGR